MLTGLEKKCDYLNEIRKIYLHRKKEIIKRLNEFEKVWEKQSQPALLKEFIFCILTPQSKAKECWRAVEMLSDKKLLFDGGLKQISEKLRRVRFKNKKAGYIIYGRRLFASPDSLYIISKLRQLKEIHDLRRWLVRNVKGFGYKEASHFLRNIGFGGNIAILDRHILKNLKLAGVIDKIPGSLSEKKYLEIERKMKEFAKKIKIPLSHLDFVLWCRQTGEIFK